MCLYTKSKNPKIAKKDIKVYKIVRLKMREGLFYTPYVETSLTEVPFENKESIEFDAQNSAEVGTVLYRVSEGFIHAYANKEFAEYNLEQFKLAYPTATYLIVDGIIPKGTKYFEDYFSDDICAKKIEYDWEYLNKERKRACQF